MVVFGFRVFIENFSVVCFLFECFALPLEYN